jgi:hypothetical protein
LTARRIDSLSGLEVVVSGDYRQTLGKTKAEVMRDVRSAGARHVGTDIRSTTDVFVRGESKLYKFGDYGEREAELAARVPRAVVIDSWGLLSLLNGDAAPVWPPNAEPVAMGDHPPTPIEPDESQPGLQDQPTVREAAVPTQDPNVGEPQVVGHDPVSTSSREIVSEVADGWVRRLLRRLHDAVRRAVRR